MLRVNRKRIKLALKSPPIWTIVVGVLVLASVVSVTGMLANINRTNGPKYTTLRTTEGGYLLEKADQLSTQERGLSGRSKMNDGLGMIFMYTNEEQRCFWMKDMNFAIDIIWASPDKRVTHVEYGLDPNTYPKQYCATAQYVIELNAGQAKRNGFKTGSQLNF